MSNKVLLHYGVKGMRWGVRRNRTTGKSGRPPSNYRQARNRGASVLASARHSFDKADLAMMKNITSNLEYDLKQDVKKYTLMGDIKKASRSRNGLQNVEIIKAENEEFAREIRERLTKHVKGRRHYNEARAKGASRLGAALYSDNKKTAKSLEKQSEVQKKRGRLDLASLLKDDAKDFRTYGDSQLKQHIDKRNAKLNKVKERRNKVKKAGSHLATAAKNHTLRQLNYDKDSSAPTGKKIAEAALKTTGQAALGMAVGAAATGLYLATKK